MATSFFTKFLAEATIQDFDTDCPVSSDCRSGVYGGRCIFHGMEAGECFSFWTAMRRAGPDVRGGRFRIVDPWAAHCIATNHLAAA